jgi:hypothetical protein
MRRGFGKPAVTLGFLFQDETPDRLSSAGTLPQPRSSMTGPENFAIGFDPACSKPGRSPWIWRFIEVARRERKMKNTPRLSTTPSPDSPM